MTLSSWLGLYSGMAALLLPVFACAAVGAGWGLRKLHYPGEFIAVLTTAVTTPALVFHTLLTTRIENTRLAQIAGTVLLGLALVAALGALLLALARLPVASLLPTVTFPNADNIGLPVAQLAFGETGLAIAVAFFALTSILQHTLGVAFVSRGGSVRRAWPVGVFVSCGAALLLRLTAIDVPQPVLESARLVGSLSVPLMLLSLGYALVTVKREGLGRGSLAGAIRLLTGFAAGYLITHLFNLPALVASVIALQLMLPVAVVSYLYADRFTDQGDVAAGAVLVSTVLFVLISPLMLWWVGAPI
jgi:predicted permease